MVHNPELEVARLGASHLKRDWRIRRCFCIQGREVCVENHNEKSNDERDAPNPTGSFSLTSERKKRRYHCCNSYQDNQHVQPRRLRESRLSLCLTRSHAFTPFSLCSQGNRIRRVIDLISDRSLRNHGLRPRFLARSSGSNQKRDRTD